MIMVLMMMMTTKMMMRVIVMMMMMMIVPKNSQGSNLHRYRIVACNYNSKNQNYNYLERAPQLLLKRQNWQKLSQLGETPEDAMSRAYREEFARIMGANNKGKRLSLSLSLCLCICLFLCLTKRTLKESWRPTINVSICLYLFLSLSVFAFV